ncbi:ribonuclease h [Plakobranchus ocellatus]|uniref:Ribonuclease h n=1 Tax=Plakobranchus ocellatus TaxID=259542 RepID=A0AAV4B394_9GAST|nr:ribonuclease h [Plakobranchus ocellatus]
MELMAVTECLRVVIEKQWKGAALPGVVIVTDCRALVRALGGSGSEGVGEAVLLADYLLKTEGVRTVVQWIPSHAGVFGKEIADGLANEGRSMPQPRKPLTLSDARSVLQRGCGVRRSCLMMNDFPSMRPGLPYPFIRGRKIKPVSPGLPRNVGRLFGKGKRLKGSILKRLLLKIL